MTNDQKIQKLYKAKELLQEAVEIVSDIFSDGNTKVYWIDQVLEHIDKQNRYNLDINDLIQKIENSPDDGEWEEDELLEEEEDWREYEDYHSKS